jgi:predicted alpha/beta superfamily hydrolase
MKIFIKRTLPLIIFIIGTFQGIFAQNSLVINDSIYSNILKEERYIRIRLPEQCKPGLTEKYDVIYMTDGEWVNEMFSFIYNFAKNEKFLPSLIQVSISNKYIDGINMRDRDFLPEKVPYNNLAGGADNFLAFFKDELIPYINKKYPSNGLNSLFGHSYGGTFAMYALLKAPQLFDTYYCSDPSLSWNDNYLITLANKTFETTTVLDKTLWINGIEATAKWMGSTDMNAVLKTKAPKKLRWKISLFPNETHNSVRLKGIYDGLKFAYDGYTTNSISFHPMNGVLLKGKSIPIHMTGSYSSVRYTTNGSEPDTSSLLAGQTIEIGGPANLFFKSFGSNLKYGATGKGNFELGEVWKAIQNPNNIKSGGLRYSYYEGKWNTLPDFSKLKPVKTGIADSTFKLKEIKNITDFACLFEGYIKINTEGYYIFALDSDDGAKLFLNGKQIIDNDGIHGTGNMKSYVVPLQKGYYPIRIEFFQGSGGLDLQLQYLTPEINRPIPIPFNLQYN